MIKRGIIACVVACTIFTQEAERCHDSRLTYGVKSAACVMGDFVWKLIDFDTLWILGLATPVYLSARFLDKDIHSYFYCDKHHTNINQMPSWCYYTAKVGVPLELIALSFLSFSSRYELAKTAQVFALTLPITWGIKKGLKQIKSECCRRPKNQFFNPYKKYYNACPSGHAFETVYAATYFTLREGWKVGLPLWIFAAGVSGELIACNRHFTSQVIAGSAVGVAAGFAADKVARRWLRTGDACSFSAQGNSLLCTIRY